jgi:hypothetical protein
MVWNMAFGNALKRSAVCGCLLLLSALPAFAESAHIGPVTSYFNAHIKPWISDPLIVASLKVQNRANARLTSADITALDAEWIAEVENERRPMIDKTLSSAVSQFLRAREEDASGTITEIILMDARGLNVGQSDVTSDFWQGDEVKYTMTYLSGPSAIFVDEALRDDSTQTFQSQISATITDETGKPIGAIAVGINLDQL